MNGVPISGHAAVATGARFRVLFVCTGNRARSPFAAALLARALEREYPGLARVTSAGTMAQSGGPMDPRSRAALENLGLSGAAFSSRRLTPGMLAGTDLAIGFEQRHVDAVLTAWPAGLRRTFMLSALTALASGPARDMRAPSAAERGDAPARWRTMIAEAAAARAGVRAEPIADPIAMDAAGYAAVLALIASHVAILAGALAGPRPVARP